MKKKVFIDLNDGSSDQHLQLVVEHNLFNRDVKFGASICVSGKIQLSLNKDRYEMICDNLELLGTCSDNYPFTNHGTYEMQTIRSYMHLRMQHYKMASVLRARNSLEMAFHEFFQEKGFLHVHTPVLTSSNCEGGGDVFTVVPEHNKDEEIKATNPEKMFFKTPTFLSVSGQLHLEACALGMGDVYTLNPAFRSEKSHTRKHLNEFHMLEVELSHTKSLYDIMHIMEESIKFSLHKLHENCSQDLVKVFDEVPDHKLLLESAINKPYIKMSYAEAVEVLNKNSDQLEGDPPDWGSDLNTEHENFLVNYCDSIPVFIFNPPESEKPFYMPTNEDGKTVAAVDLIFPKVGELCGGSLRHNDLETLESILTKRKMLPAYDWYLDLRRYGNTPHAGYGMGFDRLVTFAMGVHNIRDAVPFPRYPNSCVL